MSIVEHDMDRLKRRIIMEKDITIKKQLLVELTALLNLVNDNYNMSIFAIGESAKIDDVENINVVNLINAKNSEWFINNYAVLNDMCQNLRPLADYKIPILIFTPFKEEILKGIFTDFMQQVDINFSKRAIKGFNNGRVRIGRDKVSPRTLNLHLIDAFYVILNKFEDIFDLNILCHEMGHVYLNLSKDSEKGYLNYYKDFFNNEILSHLFELMYINYLLDNDCYHDEGLKILMQHDKRFIDTTRRLSKGFDQNSTDSVFQSFMYFFGFVYARNLFLQYDEKIDINKMVKIISLMDDRKLSEILSLFPIDYPSIISDVQSDFNSYSYCLKRNK